MAPEIFCNILVRSNCGIFDQIGKAFWAALTALSTSLSSPKAILPISSSVAGLKFSPIFLSLP
jgi:hypothetical protein